MVNTLSGSRPDPIGSVYFPSASRFSPGTSELGAGCCIQVVQPSRSVPFQSGVQVLSARIPTMPSSTQVTSNLGRCIAASSPGRLFQLSVLDPLGDFLGNRMRERSGRPRALGVEVRAHGVLTFQDLFTRAVSNSILNIASLATRTQANHQAFGSVARSPPGDLCVEGVNRGRRRRGGFGYDVEVLAQHDLELGDELWLHQFQVVGQLDTRRRREGMNDDDRLALRIQANG